MSLLADLLSKIKQPQAKREVPPNLKNIVQSSSNKSSANRKIILLSVILVVFVLAGIAALFFVNQLKQSSNSSIALTSPAGSSEPVVRETVKTVKSEIKKPQTGQKHKTADDSLGKTVASTKGMRSTKTKPAEKIVKKAASPAAGSSKWKPSPKAPRIAQASRRGMSSQGAWGKGAVEIDKIINDPIKKPEPSVQKEEKDTKQRDFHLYSAREHELKSDYSKALADYKKALVLDNANIKIMNSISYVYLQIGIYDASISHSQNALDINNKYLPALTNMGIALAKQDKPKEAESYFRSALTVEPENQNVLLNIAVLFERQDMYELSADYYGRLIRLGNTEGMLGLARVYEKQGEADKAVQIYRDISSHESIDEKTKSKIRQRVMRLLNN